MRKSPVTIQEWLDALPPPKSQPADQQQHPVMPQSQYTSTHRPSLRLLGRDASIQSDDCSHCSSVESVLELRRPDPEAVLLGLGFGPTNGQQVSRIPSRFLQPSKLLTKIDINKFLEEQGEGEKAEFTSVPTSPARVKATTN